jgi:AcrR family transcriptional regulator
VTKTRDRFITATNELFRRYGYNGTSLKQVTEAAAAPVGSLYHFFPGGKAELTEAVIEETGAAYLELFELIADSVADPADAVEAFFSAAADTLEQTGYIDVCPIGTIAREVASTDDRLRSAASKVFASWANALAARFCAAGLDQQHAARLANTVICALEGSFVLGRTSRDADAVRHAGTHLGDLVRACITQATDRDEPAVLEQERPADANHRPAR